MLGIEFRKVLASVSLFVLLPACSETEMTQDLQGETVTSAEAAADRFCQQDEGLEFGSTEYVACRKYVGDYARRVVGMGAI